MAVLFEPRWAVGLGCADGFRNLRASAVVAVALAPAVVLLVPTVGLQTTG